MLAVFLQPTTVSAEPLSDFGALSTTKLSDEYVGPFSQNNINYWNPNECVNTEGVKVGDSCFKIDSSVSAQDFWYAEGCLSKCKSSSYAHTAYDSKNPFLRNDTESDESLGGMLYIYADNYDINYDDGWIPKFTSNGGSSTQKYYWVVLPSEAYSNGFGETYVATFENMDDPIYFITFDTHACEHQSEDYCGKANADPDGVQAGRQFLGAITDTGSPTAAANILGKLTSLCRINGRGEVTASQDASNAGTIGGEASSLSSGSPGSSITSGKTVAEKIWNWFAKANISGLSDNPAAIAGIIGAFATESGGNTIEGINPFAWSNWGGTLLGCIPMYCGDIKSRVTGAVGHDYFAYKTGVDGIPEEAIDKAIDLELKFIMNDFNGGTNWKTFVENLGIVSNKTPESYAELFEVIVQNAGDPSGDAVQDEGIIKWVASHPGYSTVQQVLGRKRELARAAYEKLANSDSNCECTNGQKIADKAKELAWSEVDAGKASSPTSAFTEAAKAADVNDNDDCLSFVKTAIIASGADTEYPTDYSEYQLVDYMNSSSKWKKIDTTSESDLQPGDVLVSAVNGRGNNHIFVYLGSGKAAAANLNIHYGRIGNLSDEWCKEWGGKTAFQCVDNPFQVFRLNSEDCGSGEFKFYGQSDPKWGSKPFGSTTISSGGCGPTSFAMLATELLGKDILPDETAKVAGDAGMHVPGAGSSWQITKTLADHYGLEYEKIDASSVKDAIDKINQHLQDGWKIHISGHGGTLYGGGHYIGIRELTSDGKWLLADSGKAQENSEKPWDPETVMSGAYLANIHAIRGTSTSPNCGDICEDPGSGNTGALTGGLTEDQAQKLAEYYNSGGGADCASGTRQNCYNLSMWWLCNFTDVVEPPTNACSGVGTGAEVVGCLKESYGLETGTEPRPYAVFSTTSFHGTIHTGVVVAVNDSKEVITVEAAYPKWSDLGHGWARVWPFQSVEGHSITFAYLDGRIDMEKLKEAIGD